MESLRTVRQDLHRWLKAACLLLLLALCPGGGFSQSAIPDEYEVRAAILLNIVKFVSWPQPRSARALTPFVVGLLGYDAQSAALERFLAPRTLDGRPIVVRRIAAADRLDDCSVVYVSRGAGKGFDQLRPEFARLGILTVSDDERFLLRGGMVSLPLAGDHIEIQINPAQAQRSGLTVSSRLLRLARVMGQ